MKFNLCLKNKKRFISRREKSFSCGDRNECFKIAQYIASKLRFGRREAGFTLIELLVSMGLFVIFTAIATVSFVNALKNQRIASALMAVSDSANLSIEQMAREIRTATAFHLINSEQIEFLNAEGNMVSYKLNVNNGTIERGVEDIVLGNYNFKPITADNVKIGRFTVRACGENKDNNPPSINDNNFLDACGGGSTRFPPRITLFLSATSKDKDVEKLNIFINVQTTVSARVIR